MSGQKNNQIQLPDRLTSSADLSRTVRELEELDGVLRQARLRADQKEVHAPRSSVTLEQLAHLNNVTIVEDDQRQQLAAALATLEQDAPRIHMSLATEPSAKFTRRIVVWLRTNVHPLILLGVVALAVAAKFNLITSSSITEVDEARFTEVPPVFHT